MIAANVRATRLKRGMPLEGLAAAAIITTAYLQRVEYGRVNISVVTLVTLARALETRLDTLVESARLEGGDQAVPGAGQTERSTRGETAAP
ncbi:helix-turn-helix domain-containing protein [Corallococcus interemptor]|uniref:Helix-turn-helix domain-containing protein n=1 Tax=Corallococcus interemptor TaxID=2316720 RepID=A0A3A8QRG9_9BACT|nr:helix-turn-helix domain-containing protein [Corallococcus interemptor]